MVRAVVVDPVPGGDHVVEAEQIGERLDHVVRAWSWPSPPVGRRRGARRTAPRPAVAPSPAAARRRRPRRPAPLPATCPWPSATAWRASAIDGRVSPMVLNSRNSSASPGIERLTSPAVLHRRREHLARCAGQQRAIEIEERRALPTGRAGCRSPVDAAWSSARLYAKTGETPLGGSGVSQPEPCDWGNHIGGFFRTEPIGGEYRSTTCESMHVNE